MDIISLEFISASLAAGVLFYLVKPQYRSYYLAVLSSAFILSLNFWLLSYVFFYSFINYIIGRKIGATSNKILFYRLGIVFNLLQLILLRYASFTIDPLFNFFGSELQVSKLSQFILPIGISYFTLQGIGYLINIKMGWEKPEKKFPDFLLYIIFFPKFLSGPIERSNHFLPQIKEEKKFNGDQISSGLRTVFIGFFKKVVIANQLAPYVFDVFTNISSLEGYQLLIILILLPVYLYFDFSGYTDIAIGIARFFGIELLPNFNRPFFAVSVSDFWRRFHISLASWFTDYVFRQTVLRRRKWGIYSSVYAVFITWTLFGIWHGGGWHFMLLGLLQALAINYEFFTKKFRVRMFSKLPGFFSVWIGRITTYLFYCISLVFFFSENLRAVFMFFSNLFKKNGPIVIDDLSLLPFELIAYIPLLIFLEFLQNDHPNLFNKLEGFWLGHKRWNIVFRWTVFSLMITIIFITGLKSEQFVYANF